MSNPEPRLVVGSTTHTRITRSYYKMTIETSDPTGLHYANRVARFKELRVGCFIELSTEADDEEDFDGACSPNLGLFEPLIAGTDQYHLPWFTPAGMHLEDSGAWGGWEAWLGNDNLQIHDNRLSILANDGARMHVRWSGRLPQGEPFLYEGPIEIRPVVFYVDNSFDVPAMLERVFGAEQARRVHIEREPNTETTARCTMTLR